MDFATSPHTPHALFPPGRPGLAGEVGESLEAGEGGECGESNLREWWAVPEEWEAKLPLPTPPPLKAPPPTIMVVITNVLSQRCGSG